MGGLGSGTLGRLIASTPGYTSSRNPKQITHDFWDEYVR